MSELGRQILASRTMRAADGTDIALVGETSLGQAEFLAAQVRRLGATRCLEVGLAFGISSLFICDAMAGHPDARLISIDPVQTRLWKGQGLLNLERAGMRDRVEFFEDYSYAVLPRLLAEGRQLDFAYVDTTKIFDFVLLDAFYLSRLLRVGGVMVFDDCRVWPGPRRVARYLSKWPHLRVVGGHGPYRPPALMALAQQASRLVPFRRRLFADDVVEPAAKLGINYSCVAFEKVAEDKRDWRWYEHF